MTRIQNNERNENNENDIRHSQVSVVNTRAQSNDFKFDPLSALAEAENRCKTRAYQTKSDDTDNYPVSIP
jgi:hypothetical protein